MLLYTELMTGRRILNHQTNIALLNSPIATQMQSLQDPSDDRKPFRHPAIDKLQNIADAPLEEVLSKRRVAGLGTQCGMREILRWVPRNVRINQRMQRIANNY